MRPSKVERKRTMMKRPRFQVGSRIRIVSYNPFRGLAGTIRIVHEMPYLDESFCFYLIALEGSYVKEAVWFQYEEVESVSSQEFDYFQSKSKSLSTKVKQ
jgi:hypothetical protein